IDETHPMPRGDRLRERVDLLVLDLLLDRRREQAPRELRVLGLLDDEQRGGLDRELVELARGRSVVEAADGLGRDAERVDVGKTRATAGDRSDDLVEVYRLARAVALRHPHRGL